VKEEPAQELHAVEPHDLRTAGVVAVAEGDPGERAVRLARTEAIGIRPAPPSRQSIRRKIESRIASDRSGGGVSSGMGGASRIRRAPHRGPASASRPRGATFSFAEHAEPGEKLHRTMRKGVNVYDRLILICSKASVTDQAQ
jgi:hypothetical protein